MDDPDHLRFPRRLQGRPSPRFTGFTYLMIHPQIVTRHPPPSPILTILAIFFFRGGGVVFHRDKF